MAEILIDASVIFAYYNEIDVHHKKAEIIMDKIFHQKFEESFITDYIFDEVVSIIMRKNNKEKAVEVGKLLLNSEITLIKINEITFDKTWKLFQNSENLSFTDCSLIACAEIFDIKKIATFDKHFKGINGIEVVDS